MSQASYDRCLQKNTLRDITILPVNSGIANTLHDT